MCGSFERIWEKGLARIRSNSKSQGTTQLSGAMWRLTRAGTIRTKQITRTSTTYLIHEHAVMTCDLAYAAVASTTDLASSPIMLQLPKYKASTRTIATS